MKTTSWALLVADRERLRRAYDQRDNAMFDRAVELILQAKRSTSLTAQFSSVSQLFKLLFKSDFCGCAIGDGNSASNLEQLIPINKHDVLLALSFPRYATRIKGIEFAKQAQGNHHDH